MDTREMIVAIVAILAGTAVLLSPAACTINRHTLIAEAIKAGGDPQAVDCVSQVWKNYLHDKRTASMDLY